VLTVVSGDHQHLLSQVDGLSVSTWPPDVHVVVSVRDRAVTRGRLPIRCDRWHTDVLVLAALPRASFLPALELGARRALQHDAEVLVYLSVHCIPHARLLETLATEAADVRQARPAVWFGETRHLAPPPGSSYPVRRLLDLVVGEPVAAADVRDADASGWVSAFAVNASHWEEVWQDVSASCPPTSGPADLRGLSVVELRRAHGAVAFRQHPQMARAG
jgi:hypothetical protein